MPSRSLVLLSSRIGKSVLEQQVLRGGGIVATTRPALLLHRRNFSYGIIWGRTETATSFQFGRSSLL